MKNTTAQLANTNSLPAGDNLTTIFIVSVFAGLFIYAIMNKCELRCKYGNIEISIDRASKIKVESLS